MRTAYREGLSIAALAHDHGVSLGASARPSPTSWPSTRLSAGAPAPELPLTGHARQGRGLLPHRRTGVRRTSRAPLFSRPLLLRPREEIFVGGVAGLVLGGFVADRRGIKRTTLGWFAVSGAMLACLSIKMDSDLLLDVVVFLTGVFVFSAQVLVYAYVTSFCPAPSAAPPSARRPASAASAPSWGRRSPAPW